ncbi:MAG: phage major capsid protein [Rickettsiales bacterium]|nr:phage major capsid protein [Rickettsiales bacterium]
MSFTEITDRVHQLGHAWEQFKQVNDARLREVERKGQADPLYQEHLNKISDALDRHKLRVDQLETAYARPSGAFSDEKHAHTRDTEYKKAFRTYLRKGMDSALANIQTKTLSVGIDADGGFLVTDEMRQRILQTVFESSPMRQLASVETISSDTLDVIEDTQEMAASWVAETGTRGDTTTPDIGKHSIAVHEMFAQPRATQKLIDDGSIDIEQWIADRVAERFSRLESTSFVAGDGIGKPRGILSYAAGTSWGQVQQVNSGTSAVVTENGLIRLFYALKDEHARRATFLMNRATVQAIRLLKSATSDQYVWQPGLAAGTPDTLLGVPVVLAADMPVAAANSLSVAVGDFRAAYLIVDRIGVRILRDPFTDKPFIKFYTTKRVGGEVVNYEAVKLLRLAV